jgi:site-specific DNA recombinase
VILAAYLRVSTDDQKNNQTIENQRILIEEFLKLNGYKIYDFYLDDGVSGTIPLSKRPGGRRLLEDAKNKKFDTVIVTKTNRMGRTLRVLIKAVDSLSELNINFKSITEPFDTSTSVGKLIFHFIASFAEFDWSNINENTKIGKERAIRDGRWTGGLPPYGYIINRDTKKLEVFEPEAEIVIIIFDLCVNHKLSCPKIAKILKDKGIPPFTLGKNKPVERKFIGEEKTIYNAKKWYAARIRQILVDETYTGAKEMGKRSCGGEIREMAVPQIIPLEMFQKAQEILK